MTERHELEPFVHDWLHRTLDALPEPAHRYPFVANEVNRTAQDRVWMPSLRRRVVSVLQAGAAAAVVVIAVGVGVALYTQLEPADDAEPQPAIVAASPEVTPSEAPLATDAAVTNEPEATFAPDTSERAPLLVDPRIAGDGPFITWERAPELDEVVSDRDSDRRELATQPAGTFRRAARSTNVFSDLGYTVDITNGTVVDRDRNGKRRVPDRYEPLRLKVVRPDGSVTRSRIDRPLRVIAAATGPRGLVVVTEPAVGNSKIIELATDRVGVRGCRPCELDERGVLTIGKPADAPTRIRPDSYRGRLRSVGLTPADIRDIGAERAQRAWYSSDGGDWTPIKRWPIQAIGTIVATADGFVAEGDGRVAISTDGSDWVELEERVHEEAALVRWGERVLLDDVGRIAEVTLDGLRDLPISGALLGADGALGAARPFGDDSKASFGVIHVGPDGIIGYDRRSRTIAFSEDGTRFSLSLLPIGLSPGDVARSWEIDGALVLGSGRGNRVEAYRPVVNEEVER